MISSDNDILIIIKIGIFVILLWKLFSGLKEVFNKKFDKDFDKNKE